MEVEGSHLLGITLKEHYNVINRLVMRFAKLNDIAVSIDFKNENGHASTKINEYGMPSKLEFVFSDHTDDIGITDKTHIDSLMIINHEFGHFRQLSAISKAGSFANCSEKQKRMVIDILASYENPAYYEQHYWDFLIESDAEGSSFIDTHDYLSDMYGYNGLHQVTVDGLMIGYVNDVSGHVPHYPIHKRSGLPFWSVQDIKSNIARKNTESIALLDTDKEVYSAGHMDDEKYAFDAGYTILNESGVLGKAFRGRKNLYGSNCLLAALNIRVFPELQARNYLPTEDELSLKGLTGVELSDSFVQRMYPKLAQRPKKKKNSSNRFLCDAGCLFSDPDDYSRPLPHVPSDTEHGLQDELGK